MSIVDVYAYLRTVASAQSTDPGDPPHSARSVLELHFFSHSWFGRGAGEAGGPILVNTLDLLAVWRLREEFKLVMKRDPFDKDGRSTLDFVPPDGQAKPLANAVTQRATSFLWGCDAGAFWKKLITETQRLAQSKGSFVLTYNDDGGDEEDEFHARLGYGASPHQSAKLTLGEVLDVISEALGQTYVQLLARASNSVAIGALPGTYAVPDEVGSPKERYLHVAMGSATGEDTALLDDQQAKQQQI